MKKLYFYLMLLLMAVAMVGCSSDDENNNYPYDPFLSNGLRISDGSGANTEDFRVEGGKFYIDMMPTDIGPGFVFYCDIKESPDLRTLILRFRGVKACTDDFEVGETFSLDKWIGASLVLNEWCSTTPGQIHATKGSVKLVGKKKVLDNDVLTFQINDLSFDGLYTVNGSVDFEYDGIVY